ncbi:MAG: type II toxin-antitoxin system VapC family toxin [Phycisphaerae bacterium]|nr:type II toxin-antitoxin system VapC family toxin [Gemmatimonadaceae bacterium]
MIVVDTNVVAYLLVPGPQTAWAQATFRRDPLWAAPTLWRSELRSVLTQYIRQRQLPLSKALEMQTLGEALFAGREYPVDSAAVLEAAIASGCSAYDSEFAVLARGLGVSLVTADKQLLSAFPDTAVPLQTFGGPRSSL